MVMAPTTTRRRRTSRCAQCQANLLPGSIAKAILRSDLYAYVQAIFPIVSPGDTFLRNWHLEAVTHALAQVLRGETKRLIITVPPRSLKSICASVALPAFALGRDPTRRIICASYSENLARKHANDFRAVMRSQIQQELFPGCRISSAKDTELEVMTTKARLPLCDFCRRHIDRPRRKLADH